MVLFLMLNMSMEKNNKKLIELIDETKKFIIEESEDFCLSGWDNSADALEKIDSLLEKSLNGDKKALSSLGTLFAPTGPLQELSMANGWAHIYLEIAEEIDQVLAEL
jgi:hypothetical protein